MTGWYFDQPMSLDFRVFDCAVLTLSVHPPVLEPSSYALVNFRLRCWHTRLETAFQSVDFCVVLLDV